MSRKLRLGFLWRRGSKASGGWVCATTSPWQVICAAERTEIEWRKSANSPCGGQGTIWSAIREEETAKGKNNPGKSAEAGRRCQPFLVLLWLPKRFYCHPLLWIWKGFERWKGNLMMVGISKVRSLKQCSPFLKASHEQLFKGKISVKSSLSILRKLNKLTLLSWERSDPEEPRQVNPMQCLGSPGSSDISSGAVNMLVIATERGGRKLYRSPYQFLWVKAKGREHWNSVHKDVLRPQLYFYFTPGKQWTWQSLKPRKSRKCSASFAFSGIKLSMTFKCHHSFSWKLFMHLTTRNDSKKNSYGLNLAKVKLILLKIEIS